MITVNSLLDFMRLLDDDVEICVSLNDARYNEFSSAVAIHYDASERKLVIVGEE